MVVYNLYIFNRNGQCVFYREWLRKKQTKMTAEEEYKLMNGFLYSIKSFIQRITPTDLKDGFLSFKTNCYKLNYYETPTGLKFILNTDNNVGNIRDILHQLYSTIFVNYIVKNPRCSTSDIISSEQEIFITKLDEFISSLAIFSQTNKMSNQSIREASHAGSWYESDGNHLNQQLSNWLSEATTNTNNRLKARAIIAPHAGYTYSGPTAAFAYRHIDPTDIDRVFLLGPSHHYSLNNCALTNHSSYETPLYNIQIDTQTNSDLYKTGLFSLMNRQQDSDEHSLEMHLPYIAKVFEKKKKEFQLIPILVGSLDSSKFEKFGQLLAPYLCNERTLFVVSSDFCHWGRRFSYTPHNPSDGEIWQHIEKLDHQGMELIEKLNLADFHAYLRATDNTICGRYPISLLLATLEQAKKVIPANQLPKFSMQFVKYAQSSRVKKSNDSSVSYASAVLTILG